MVFSFIRRRKVGDANENGAAANRNLSSSFTEHHLSVEEMSRLYVTSYINEKTPAASKGLSSSEAASLLLKNGRNELEKQKGKSDLALFLGQFLNVLWLLLIFAALMSLIGYLTDLQNYDNLIVIVVLVVMIVAMCFGSFLQERKAHAVVRGFANLLPPASAVIRDGHEQSIAADMLVVGDIIIIKSGSRVPADARVLRSFGLKLETSSITGEPEPIEFTSEPVDPHVTVFESQNVAFNGSLCVDGEAIAVVIRTGKNTIIGQIATLTTSQEVGKSSMEMELLRFVKFLAVISLIMGAIAFVAAEFINKWKHIVYYLVNAFLVIIIANVPCGFPATVTSQLTIITRRMAARNVFMKRIDVVEAFGATTVIASDKTGTLTMNKMTVTDLWNNCQIVQGSPQTKAGGTRVGELDALFDAPLPEMLTVMCVCNKANFENEDENTKTDLTTPKFSTANNQDLEKGKSNLALSTGNSERVIIGSPSEAAMLRYCDNLFSVAALRSRHNIVFEIPFNSKRKWHLQIAELGPAGEGVLRYKLMVKGAPDILIKKCTRIAMASGEESLDEQMMGRFKDCYDNFAKNGRRVIGFATKYFNAPADLKFENEGEQFSLANLTFNGMCAIMDPPREETAGAIAKCKTAGIKVFMVTGDHPATAAAIAREIGLIGPVEQPVNERDWDICHGDEIPNLTDERWDQLLAKKYLVFGRTTPEQKLLIVEQVQKRNEIITMTGDGVNDAPALKRANVGVAMGITGSDVAKQAADIILMDDNFASIVKGIEQGRLLFDNLKKTIVYTLPHVLPEFYPLLYNFIVGFPLGLTSLQILSIDLGTELAPAISLAYEEPEADIMSRPPRSRGTRLVSNSVLCYAYLFAGNMINLSCTAAYIYVFWYNGVRISDLPYTTNTYWQVGAPVFHSNGHRFNDKRQVEIVGQACAAWYINMVFNQVFHLWICRTRRISVFRHYIHNWYAICGVAIEIALMCFFVYCPGVQTLLGARNPPPFVYIFPVINMTFVLIINEVRKWIVRTYPHSRLASCIKC